MSKKKNSKKEIDLPPVAYVTKNEQVIGIDRKFNTFTERETLNNDKCLPNNFDNNGTNSLTLMEEITDNNLHKGFASRRSNVLHHLNKVNELKMEILSIENGTFKSNNGKKRNKSAIQNYTLVESFETEMSNLKQEIDYFDKEISICNRLSNLNEKDLSVTGFLCACANPRNLYFRDVCEKASNINVRGFLYKSNMHVELCTDQKNHVRWMRKHLKISVEGQMMSPKLYISGLLADCFIEIHGIGGKPEIHISGVCLCPKIRVSGVGIKPIIYIEGIVSKPDMEVRGVKSRLKLCINGICSEQAVKIGGLGCKTKLRVFGMCNI